ncbi:MAG: eL32 family ribosomal protein, partial [Candidatus Nanoarchaeia archaeon]
MKKLLEVRRKLKAKKPSFIRHDAHKKKRISSTSWRRPKGRQNKMRLAMKGYARSRSTGFSSPQKVSGLSSEGLVQRLVVTKKDFENLDAKTDGIIFSKTVGAKKKLELIEYAQKNNFTILNLDAA